MSFWAMLWCSCTHFSCKGLTEISLMDFHPPKHPFISPNHLAKGLLSFFSVWLLSISAEHGWLHVSKLNFVHQPVHSILFNSFCCPPNPTRCLTNPGCACGGLAGEIGQIHHPSNSKYKHLLNSRINNMKPNAE